MTERLFILDGPGFLFRAYHALPFLSTSRGEPSHAVFGMSTMLWKLLREDSPDYFAVAWDPPGPTFREEQFASFHPGGKLGRRLMRVENVMHGGDSAPLVDVSTAMPDVIHEMSSKRLGMTCVVENGRRLVGIFTDGDLRRLMIRSTDALSVMAGAAMTPNPLTIRREQLAVEALRIMEQHKITSVVVVDDAGNVEGVVHLHDLWRSPMF